MRVSGSKNITPLDQRTTIATSATKPVSHLSDIGGSPLKEFHAVLRTQSNYLIWIDKRHDKIVELTTALDSCLNKPVRQGPTGAKDATFKKYRWYSEYLTLLEAINAFETFYKKSFIKLGQNLQEFIDPTEIKDLQLKASVLWSMQGNISVPELVFQSQLFHDLNTIDSMSQMLIEARRYNQNDKKNPLSGRVNALRAIFQIRHTLSHNAGRVTEGDRSKFLRLGFQIESGEIIDPAKDHFATSVLKLLHTESEEFTDWLCTETSSFLQKCVDERELTITIDKKVDLVSWMGENNCWNNVKWSA